MLKMVDGTGIIGVDMICPLGVSTPQPPNYDKVELEGTGILVLPNSLDAPLERLELIGNIVQGENPAPDNLQEIKSAGRKSKNLFDAKKAKSGWITPDGKQTLVTLGSVDNVVSDYIQVYPGMKYTSSAGVFQIFYDSEKKFLKHDPNISSSIIIPDNAKYMIVIVPVNKALAIQTANTLMINIGSSVLPYEQYTDKKLFDVKVTGKNLFDSEKAKDKSKWTPCAFNANFVEIAVYVGTGSTVTVSNNTKINNPVYYYGVALKSSEDIKYFICYPGYPNSIDTHTFTATEDYIYVRCNKTSLNEVIGVCGGLQIEIGASRTDFESYKEQTLTITSDRPITKWDRLVEQGGQYGWLYKHKIIEDFSTLVKDTEPIYGNDGGKYFSVSLQNASLNYDRSKIYSEVGVYGKDNKIHYIPQPMMANAIIHVSDTDTIMTAKEHMHYKVIYETTESQFVPLPQSEQSAIRALKTYYPTTVITVDGGEVDPDIKVTYRKEI